jgi:hypothetical protein
VLAKRVAVLSPAASEGPQRLVAAGASRVLVVGGALEPSPGVEVWSGPLSTPLRLPLRDASVDVVLCIEPYAGLSSADRTAMVEEARRVLRSTGVLAVWSADLPEALALLSPVFSQVEALGERRWVGVSLGPVGAAEGLRLVDERPSASAPAKAFLVLAGAGDLAPMVRECVVVASESRSESSLTMPVPMISLRPPPVVQQQTPQQPAPQQSGRSLGQIDDSDVLRALFEPSELKPAQAVSSAPALAEQEALQQELATVKRERDSLRERAGMLTQELRHAHAQAIDAGAELHELRRRVESQRSDEVNTPMPSLVDLDDAAALTRVLVDEVAPIVTPEPARPTADVATDRDRLREELSRRTADQQALESRLWQSEEEVQRERLENVRLVTDVDRLREQVERSRVVEHERMQELERLGHELRKLELSYAELQGLYTTGDHRLRELEASIDRENDPPEIVELEDQLRELTAERDQAQALERAANELARRRERELGDAARTIRELRRNLDEHASIAANLRGELAVMQVEVEQLGASVPGLQERLREQQRKTLEREEETFDLQRRLEEAIAEQQQLRQRLRRYKQDLEVATVVRDATQGDLDRLRGELDAKRRAVEQLQQLVALGAGGSGSGGGGGDELQALRALLAQQAGEFAERLSQQEDQQRQMVEQERERLQRISLEASIRGEEQEYLLYQLDTAEQRIWEMTDATDRSAARLAAGLAQLEKQKEQYEDLIDQLEVARTLLAEAQAKIVEFERQQASDRAKLARLTIDPGLRIDVEDEEAEVSGFDVLVIDRDDDSGMEVAPQIQRDPGAPDPLAGIDFDDDEESLAVRLAGSNFEITGAWPASSLRIDFDEEEPPSVVLPSDLKVQIDLEDEDDDLPEPPRPPPTPRRSAVPKVLRTLPFLEDDDDVFSIDTDAIEIATPTPPPPPPDRPGFDQKLTDHSNSRIVIEVLEDEAWPEELTDPTDPKSGS